MDALRARELRLRVRRIRLRHRDSRASYTAWLSCSVPVGRSAHSGWPGRLSGDLAQALEVAMCFEEEQPRRGQGHGSWYLCRWSCPQGPTVGAAGSAGEPDLACPAVAVPPPRAAVWTSERIRAWEETGDPAAPVAVWTAAQTAAS